jgi:hypothetical protein
VLNAAHVDALNDPVVRSADAPPKDKLTPEALGA